MAITRSSKSRQPVVLNRTIAASQTRQRQFPPLKVPKPFQGFFDFIREQGVVGLGVGFIVGTAANSLVRSVVGNIINPIVGLFTGGINLSQKTACLQSTQGKCTDVINYGQVISDTITFIIILLVVYAIIKSLKLDKLDKKKES